VIALARSLIPASSVAAEKGCLFGAGELMLFILAVTLLRYLLDCLSRAFGASCDRLKRRLARRGANRSLPIRLCRTMPKPPPVKRPATAHSYRTRRYVDAREALRRSCAATGNASKTDVRWRRS
jgi:hypothetical protein